MKVDYVVVGAGLTGATIAQVLHEKGFEVVVVERRDHIAGNCYDYRVGETLVNQYGPHYFRTNSPVIWNYVNRFSPFRPFRAAVTTTFQGEFYPWPLRGHTVNKLAGPRWKPEFTGKATNFEEAVLQVLPKGIYENFIYGYTKKQWGVEPRTLDASLAGRIRLRGDTHAELSLATYQGLPIGGYTHFVANMLSGVPVVFSDYLNNQDKFVARRKVFFTGPIDEFFDFSLGKLVYRAQKRTLQRLSRTRQYAQLNFPDMAVAPVRAIQWDIISGTKDVLSTLETPFTPTQPTDYEYPFPDNVNQTLYQRYRAMADDLGDVVFCGRLGEYRYYDMDQAIARALHLVARYYDT